MKSINRHSIKAYKALVKAKLRDHRGNRDLAMAQSVGSATLETFASQGMDTLIYPLITRRRKRVNQGVRMERNYLAHSTGDAINAVLAAAGYNFRLLLRWLALLCAQILRMIISVPRPETQLKPA